MTVEAVGGCTSQGRSGPPGFIPVMYPRLDAWRSVVRAVDPSGLMQSDLSRRLHLT